MELWFNYIDQILLYATLALSLNLLLGYAGQVSVAHAAFGAIGGYSMGYLAMTHHWNFLLGTLLGMGFAFVIGSVVALPALKLTVEYLILLTLAVSLEAIVLTGFVLMAQNRMTLQADKRAHLDLQVNLLAEQKLTAIEGNLIELRSTGRGQDTVRWGAKLLGKINYLANGLASADNRPTNQQLEVQKLLFELGLAFGGEGDLFVHVRLRIESRRADCAPAWRATRRLPVR